MGAVVVWHLPDVSENDSAKFRPSVMTRTVTGTAEREARSAKPLAQALCCAKGVGFIR
jgi:hypothetical protein